ncbi:hypothetical protein JCM10213_001467 [Rhodosporidiobolus nylandii]
MAAPQAAAVKLSRTKSSTSKHRSTRPPPAASTANPPPSASSASQAGSMRGKRARPSGGESELEKDRPRRSKSSRGQKRTEAVPAADDKKGKQKQEDGAAVLGEGQTVNPSYRRAMYAAYINDAFEKRAQGINDGYNSIIAQFRSLLPNPPSAEPSTSTAAPSTSSSDEKKGVSLAQLRAWLDALTNVVSKLDQSHAPLVETILAVPWATTEENFVAAYMRFVGALVSARTEWLKVVLEKCVKGFKYRSPYTQISAHALPHLTRRLIYTRIHALLRLLLSLVPTLSPSLSPLLALHFPSKREPRAAQICYIDNLLLLTDYCSALSEDVLTLVVERALNIDVEIQGEPDEWEEIEEEMLQQEEEAAAAAAAAGQPTKRKKRDLAAVRELIDRAMDEEEDDLDSDDDSDDDDDDGAGLDLDNLSSDDDEPDPVNDEDAAKRAAKANGEMSEAAIRKALENRAKLDAILKVVLDHLAAAHDDRRALEQNNTSTTALPGSVQPGGDVFDNAFAAAASAANRPSTSRETTPTKADPNLPPSASQIERRTTLFRTLLDIFDRTLLRTFKTRNVQFVLFYHCSLSVSSSDHFIGVLLGRALFDNDAPPVTRVAAAGYVASFVARARYVDAGMTRKVVRHLCGYLEGQMDDFARASAAATSLSASRGPGGAPAGVNGQELPVFYAVAQAVFYIFCFRWKDLLEEEEDVEDDFGMMGMDTGRRWMMGLETVKKAVGSSFNPLKVCAQPVVTQFASIAHKTGFMYCYAILDANRRATSYRDPAHSAPSHPHPPAPPLRSVSTSSMLNTLVGSSLHLSTPLHSPAGTPAPPSYPFPSPSSSVPGAPNAAPRALLVAEEMDSFFPFDPFKLPLSSVYIDDIYREWEAADEDDTSTSGGEASSSTADEDSDEETDSSSSAADDSDDDDEPAWAKSRGGLAVPGMGVGGRTQDEDDEVSRSFEAMSLSLSPREESFGGRRALEAMNAGGTVKGKRGKARR